MAEKLTLQQQTAVENRGGKLLVSAAAGSGKTKVLVDRLLRYLRDTKDPADLDDFLVITYTKAAAAELRGKIAEKLIEAIAEDPGNVRLQQQVQRLCLTKISTVHAFCTDILREYAYKTDVPSDFRVADENECVELQMIVLEDLLDQLYTIDLADSDLGAFLETQGLGRDDRQIPGLILQVYNSSRCHLDPDAWLDKCARLGENRSILDPAETPWGAYLIQDLHSFLDKQIFAIGTCVSRLEGCAGGEKLSGLLSATITELLRLREAKTWQEIYIARNIDFGRMPDTKKIEDTILVERIKAVREHCKERVKKKLEPFSGPAEQVLQDLYATANAAGGLIQLVRRFASAYDSIKRSRRILDFSDLEQRTLDLLLGKSRSGPTVVARELSQRFREVMVDEYQDSNAVQDAIFSSLTDQKRNCFMVGDVKQSIYQFRLADPGIFLQKYHSFVPSEEAAQNQDRKVLLNRNFRSGAGVLSAVNEVFAHCMSNDVGGLDYTPEEYLYPGVPKISLGEPETELYGIRVSEDTYEEEADFVAERIVSLLDGSHYVREGEALRPIRPEDIVILLRSPRSLGGTYMMALAKKGIRCQMEGDIDLLGTEEVRALWAMLQVISNPLQDIPLLAVLMGKVFGFTADDLAQIRASARKCPFYEALKQSPMEKAKEFLKILESLRTEARMCSLSELMELILSVTRADSVFAAMGDGEIRTGNIQAFCKIAADFEQTGNRDLAQFLQYLTFSSERGLSVPGEQGSGSVSICSIHKSKGLEYPVVFLCGLSRRFNMEDTYAPVLCDRELGLGLSCADLKNRTRYPSVAKRAIAQKMVQQSISEELRVLYVAMTRARDRLIMTYASDHLDKTLTDLVSRAELSGGDLMTAQVSNAGSWVLQTALTKAEAGAFFAVAGYPGDTFLSEYPWKIAIVDGVEEDYSEAEYGDEEDMLDEAITEKMALQLPFRYPHMAATQTPSKITATQLKGRYKDREVSENTETKTIQKRRRKPSFEESNITGAEYGSALHAAMQYISYSCCVDEAGVAEEIRRLEREQYLSPRQASLVNTKKIAAFFATPLGKKLMNEKELLREFKISLLQDAEDLPGEKILLQGVVDCAMIEEDGITVIDFKTDRVHEGNVEAILDRYRPQVTAYAQALSRIWKKDVKQILLYLFDINEFIPVSQ